MVDWVRERQHEQIRPCQEDRLQGVLDVVGCASGGSAERLRWRVSARVRQGEGAVSPTGHASGESENWRIHCVSGICGNPSRKKRIHHHGNARAQIGFECVRASHPGPSSSSSSPLLLFSSSPLLLFSSSPLLLFSSSPLLLFSLSPLSPLSPFLPFSLSPFLPLTLSLFFSFSSSSSSFFSSSSDSVREDGCLRHLAAPTVTGA